MSNGGSFSESFMEQRGLEIIPRDPETYQDWKVGDRFLKDGSVFEIRVEDNGFFFAITDGGFLTGRTDKLFSGSGARLVLTDYERKLLAEQEKEKCPFKEADKVLVRDYDSSEWRFAILESYNENCEEPYRVKSSVLSYRQCLPLNEHTWALLGTTGEYKATNNNESH